MGKALDDLAKDLATGHSRRTALKRFVMAIGAAAGAQVGRPASAPGNARCVRSCREQGLRGREFGACVAASAHCPDGECAFVLNGNVVACVPVT